MIVLDDILLGLLTSGIITLADRVDIKLDKKQKKTWEDFIGRARRLQNPDDQLRAELYRASRDAQAATGAQAKVARKLSDALVPDPLIAVEMTKWLLEPDPAKYESRRAKVIENVVQKTACPSAEVEEFISSLEHRIDSHLGLANLRTNAKLTAVLETLRDSGGLADPDREQRSLHRVPPRSGA